MQPKYLVYASQAVQAVDRCVALHPFFLAAVLPYSIVRAGDASQLLC